MDCSPMPRLILDNTMGAAFVGVVVAACLHGVSCVQVYYYFTHQKDRWPLKTLVAAVMLFDTVHQVLISHTVYSYLVSNFNNPIYLTRLVWSLLVEVLFNGFTALLVQSFLTLRVWRLSNKNVVITFLVSTLVLAEFGCVIAFTSMALALPDQSFLSLSKLKALSITVNALAAAGDVLIAGILCWLLHRSRTGFQKSDTMINKLILFAVNTGLLTSLCAVASLISIVCAPNTFLYIAFFFCIGRLYTNSLLATLNARKMIRAAVDGVLNSTSSQSVNGTGQAKFSSFSLRDFGRTTRTELGSPRRHHQCPTTVSITIDTLHEHDRDCINSDEKRQEFLDESGACKESRRCESVDVEKGHGKHSDEDSAIEL